MNMPGPGPYCCPFCCKAGIGVHGGILLGDDGGRQGHLGKLGAEQKMFFKLLKRYLGQGGTGKWLGDPTSFPFPLEELEEINLICCEECRKLIKSFCDLYHEMKRVELHLSWRVGKLMNGITSARRVPVKMACFQDCIIRSLEALEGFNGPSEGVIDDVTESTKSLVKICFEKLKTAFPILSISNHNGGESNIGGHVQGHCYEEKLSSYHDPIRDIEQNRQESNIYQFPSLPTIPVEMLASHHSNLDAIEYLAINARNSIDGGFQGMASTPDANIPHMNVDIHDEGKIHGAVQKGFVQRVVIKVEPLSDTDDHCRDFEDGEPETNDLSHFPQILINREVSHEAVQDMSVIENERSSNCPVGGGTGNKIPSPTATEMSTQGTLRYCYRRTNCGKTWALQKKSESHLGEAYGTRVREPEEIEEDGMLSNSEDDSGSNSICLSSSSQSDDVEDLEKFPEVIGPKLEVIFQEGVQHQHPLLYGYGIDKEFHNELISNSDEEAGNQFQPHLQDVWPVIINIKSQSQRQLVSGGMSADNNLFACEEQLHQQEPPLTVSNAMTGLTNKDARVTNPLKVKQKRNPVIIHDHITILTGEPRMYKCNLCNKKFKTKAHINYHNFCVKGNKPFKCETCGKRFISKEHYEYHLRIHTGERPFTCPKCGKGFNQQGKVNRHMRSHTGEKPYVCQQCNGGFGTAQGLRCHKRIQTGERPFACTYCSKRFTEMTNLKKHVITHTGERPFSCTQCGKSFGLKWTLDLHLKTHSTERPYSCDQCTRAFSNSKDLRRHLVIHSGERPYQCGLCTSSFHRKDNLDRHIKNTHNQPSKVAKQLANEAAAEYLKNNSNNWSPAIISGSRINSLVISNILKSNELTTGGVMGENHKDKAMVLDSPGDRKKLQPEQLMRN